MNILKKTKKTKKTKKSNRRTRRTRTIRKTSKKKNIKTNNRKVKKSKKNKKNNIKPKRGGEIVHTTDIEEYKSEVLTYGLVSCISIFWHNTKTKTNFLGHDSERQISQDYHLLNKLKEILKTQHEFINEIYIYSPIGIFRGENELIDKLKNEYKKIDFKIKFYHNSFNIIRSEEGKEDYLIGLSETGELIDEYEIAYPPK